jgi:hypothetical protein
MSGTKANYEAFAFDALEILGCGSLRCHYFVAKILTGIELPGTT